MRACSYVLLVLVLVAAAVEAKPLKSTFEAVAAAEGSFEESVAELLAVAEMEENPPSEDPPLCKKTQGIGNNKKEIKGICLKKTCTDENNYVKGFATPLSGVDGYDHGDKCSEGVCCFQTRTNIEEAADAVIKKATENYSVQAPEPKNENQEEENARNSEVKLHADVQERLTTQSWVICKNKFVELWCDRWNKKKTLLPKNDKDWITRFKQKNPQNDLFNNMNALHSNIQEQEPQREEQLKIFKETIKSETKADISESLSKTGRDNLDKEFSKCIESEYFTKSDIEKISVDTSLKCRLKDQDELLKNAKDRCRLNTNLGSITGKMHTCNKNNELKDCRSLCDPYQEFNPTFCQDKGCPTFDNIKKELQRIRGSD